MTAASKSRREFVFLAGLCCLAGFFSSTLSGDLYGFSSMTGFYHDGDIDTLQFYPREKQKNEEYKHNVGKQDVINCGSLFHRLSSQKQDH